MAKFRCNNCGHTFYENLDHKPSFEEHHFCPVCHSAWTDYVGPGIEEPAPKEEEKEKSG